MKKNNLIVFVLSVLILVMFNRVFLSTFTKTNSYFTEQKYMNMEQVTPEKLYNKVWRIIYKDYYESSYNKQDWYRWKHKYQGMLKTNDDAKIAIDTMLASLNEPYTRFMNKGEFLDLTSSITSKICGIGVHIYSESGKIVIFNVMSGTPADFVKLKQGDIIIAIDGKETNGMSLSEVASLVRGPENSVVELTLLRKNKKIVKTIKRKEIKIKSVKSSIIDNHIGYIQVASFMSSTTPVEFVDALENTQNTDSIILDLRGNTGGLLDNAVFIADSFLDNGKIVDIIYRNGNKKTILAHDNDYNLNKPMIILVNSASASASEILSGALKDSNKAILVGRKTFGKGLVQKVVPLPNMTGINVTIAKYLTPKGVDINKHGIKPDYELGNKYDIMINTKKDIQLEKAVELLNDKIRITRVGK